MHKAEGREWRGFEQGVFVVGGHAPKETPYILMLLLVFAACWLLSLLSLSQEELAGVKGASSEAQQLQQQTDEQASTIRSLQVRVRVFFLLVGLSDGDWVCV